VVSGAVQNLAKAVCLLIYPADFQMAYPANDKDPCKGKNTNATVSHDLKETN